MRLGQLGQLGDRLLRLGLEALERPDRQADVRHRVARHEAGHGDAGLLELAQLQPGEALRLPQHGGERVDVLHVGQSVEVALGLLGDFQRRPQHDDRFFRQVAEQAGGLAAVGELALEVDQAKGVEIAERAECVEVEAFDRLDLVAEEVDTGGEADLVVVAGQVDVDDPAADCEVAGDFDLVEPVVPVLGEPDDQLLGLQLVAGVDRADELLELTARRYRLHERLHRGDQERVQGRVSGYAR